MQPTDLFQSLLNELLNWWGFWGPFAIRLIGIIVVWISLIIISRFVTRFLRKRAVKVGVPPDAVNGAVLVIRLITLWIGIIVLFFITPELWNSAVLIIGGSSLLIGTATGLAIGQAVRNFVAGLYVMISNPFDVGDYVRIGGNEGIVLEIGMNFTKIRQTNGSIALIPNANVIDLTVTNFCFERVKSKIESEVGETTSLPKRILKSISSVIDTSKLIQYTFNMAFPITKDITIYNKAFDTVCKGWKT
ncbi:MAG: mechanosensitive ion channel family protein, partial [Promethearchaeota archaeon]